jgi:hypothetical protein
VKKIVFLYNEAGRGREGTAKFMLGIMLFERRAERKKKRGEGKHFKPRINGHHISYSAFALKHLRAARNCRQFKQNYRAAELQQRAESERNIKF